MYFRNTGGGKEKPGDFPAVLMLRCLLNGSCSGLQESEVEEGLGHSRGRENQTPSNSPMINPEVSRALCYKQLKCEITKETNETEKLRLFSPPLGLSPISTSPY